jgi:hypothetical protein
MFDCDRRDTGRRKGCKEKRVELLKNFYENNPMKVTGLIFCLSGTSAPVE